jgi:hypothetical protein
MSWDALSNDLLQLVFAALPDLSGRAAARMARGRWRSVADDGAEVWGAVAVRRRPTTAAPPLPPAQLAALLSRQRRHLRRVQIDLRAFGGQDAAGAAALVLASACSDGSGLTDIALGIGTQEHRVVLEVSVCWPAAGCQHRSQASTHSCFFKSCLASFRQHAPAV